MKTTLLFLLIALFSVTALAQGEAAEKNFARDIKKFKVEKYSMGEDASSGYNYVIYKRGAAIVKIRTIWSSSANPAWWVEDVYYQGGQAVLMVRFSLTKRQYKAVVRGGQAALAVNDRYILKDAKLVKWTEKGRAVPASDARWAETEKDIVTSAKDTLELYPELKEQ
jgi:hypothetical protein